MPACSHIICMCSTLAATRSMIIPVAMLLMDPSFSAVPVVVLAKVDNQYSENLTCVCVPKAT